MQAQRPAQTLSLLPRGFARLLRFLFYTDIVVLILSVAGMSRLAILQMLPLFVIAGFALWIIAHWIRLDQYQRAIYVMDEEEGLWDRAFAGGGMRVGWDEIAQVSWTNWGGFRGLKITLKNNRATMARLGTLDRITAYVNLLCYGSPFVYWQAWSDTPLEEYKDAIEARLAERETA